MMEALARGWGDKDSTSPWMLQEEAAGVKVRATHDRSACLDGVRVPRAGAVQAGPRGGMLLSDLGAEVIKVEPLGGEETRRHPPVVRGQSVYFSVYNRGKKSICLDLRSAKGKEIFAALVAKADIVLENFRPGVMAAMGFAYEQLCALNPGIIPCRCPASGSTAPTAIARPSTLGQAMAASCR
jgi:crotonobetainyl-CoA:carnitine CoA-transferase CaiB-like acyl-CoA transferase